MLEALGDEARKGQTEVAEGEDADTGSVRRKSRMVTRRGLC